ncbi:MAG: hypothetical protein RL029_570 [Actinomycetota bacterium]|jgi:probable phosphomutase (TIGR03848 family)
MTTFIFLRHAVSTANEAGLLAGRIPGIELSTKGEKQAKSLVHILNSLHIDKVLVSPQDRCLQTIKPWLTQTRRRAVKEGAFQEMDYGVWSGCKLKDLSKTKEWKQIQKSPSTFKFPDGESFLAAQRRVQKGLSLISEKYPKRNILIVSHGDIIKMAVASTLDLEIDKFQRIIVDPASLTTLVWQGNQRSVVSLNSTLKRDVKEKPKSLANRRVLGGGSGE